MDSGYLSRKDRKTAKLSAQKSSLNECAPVECAPIQRESSAPSRSLSEISTHNSKANFDFEHGLKVNVELDLITIGLLLVAISTRFYRIGHPNNIV